MTSTRSPCRTSSASSTKSSRARRPSAGHTCRDTDVPMTGQEGQAPRDRVGDALAGRMALVPEFEVRFTPVHLVAVAMVDGLGRHELAAEHALHDDAVHEHVGLARVEPRIAVALHG